MEFSKLLELRRSIRDYEDKEVPTDLIKEIIRDSIKAPNGRNLQAWRFIIVNSKKFIQKITDSCLKSVLADLEKNPDSPYKMIESRVRSGEFQPFYNAPALILIVGSDQVRTLPLDSGILTAYFMLSAASRGLGTCFTFQGTLIEDKDIRKELGIPEDNKIFASIIIGYPKAIPAMPERKEPEILRIIS
jgi:nitroreductase